MRILVDMDGVVADSLPTWLQEYNLLADGSDHLKVSDIKSYVFEKFARFPKLLYATLEIAQVFKRSLPMPGALEAVHFLRSQGHEIHFVTYNHAAVPSGFNQKLDWLQHYGLGGPDDVTFQRDKSHTDGDILVEDNPDNVAAWLSRHPEGRAVLILHGYNKNFEHPRCINAATILDGLRQLGVVR